MLAVVQAMRLSSNQQSIDFQDTSNCTWTDWSVCSLVSDSRCASSRTLQVLPFESQTLDLPNSLPCSGNAGHTEQETCTGGLCPTWTVGNWTECSGNCESKQPWEDYQNRNVKCADSDGVLYRFDVCGKLYGLAQTPATEQPCACSHQVSISNPYQSPFSHVSI